MAKHNPKTSPAVIVRYLRADTGKTEIAERVKGQSEAVAQLKICNEQEKEPKKYGYLWRWEDPQAALAYELEKLNRNSRPEK